MPIIEYDCDKCRSPYAHIQRYDDNKVCPDCGLQGKKKVSVPGYRRDHTITEDT